jgi:hypothetical protein
MKEKIAIATIDWDIDANQQEIEANKAEMRSMQTNEADIARNDAVGSTQIAGDRGSARTG